MLKLKNSCIKVCKWGLIYAFAQPHTGLIVELFFFFMLSQSSDNQIKFAYKDDYNSNISLQTFGLDLLLMLLAISAKIFKILFLANRGEGGGTGWDTSCKVESFNTVLLWLFSTVKKI